MFCNHCGGWMIDSMIQQVKICESCGLQNGEKAMATKCWIEGPVPKEKPKEKLISRREFIRFIRTKME